MVIDRLILFIEKRETCKENLQSNIQKFQKILKVPKISTNDVYYKRLTVFYVYYETIGKKI